tara:strand:- start:88 stop:690 length:603 start_codon:yes stop_codon:yes gene_type:complete
MSTSPDTVNRLVQFQTIENTLIRLSIEIHELHNQFLKKQISLVEQTPKTVSIGTQTDSDPEPASPGVPPRLIFKNNCWEHLGNFKDGYGVFLTLQEVKEAAKKCEYKGQKIDSVTLNWKKTKGEPRRKPEEAIKLMNERKEDTVVCAYFKKLGTKKIRISEETKDTLSDHPRCSVGLLKRCMNDPSAECDWHSIIEIKIN